MAKRERGWIGEMLLAYGPPILAVILIRLFIFEPFRIPSSSMLPTLLIGDQVVVSKYAYGIWLHIPFPEIHNIPAVELMDLGDPERGDVIVFLWPVDNATNFIKRVVAIPGDKVRVVDNQVVVNGEVHVREAVGRFRFVDDHCVTKEARHGIETIGGVPHDVLVDDRPGSLANMPEVEVPPGHVFVMGDYRDNSQDSRSWRFVRFDQIKGKAHWIWISYDGCLPGVRVDRTGRHVSELVGTP